jgi:hypothetical protein
VIRHRSRCRYVNQGRFAVASGDISSVRRYTTFPRGLPGVGLLFLRAAFGLRLIIYGSAFILDAHGMKLGIWFLGSFALATGASLVLGFLTPLAAGVSALAEVGLYLWHPVWTCLFLAPRFETVIVAIAIALLGPGSISLDAYFFGRRKIVIPRVVRS